MKTTYCARSVRDPNPRSAFTLIELLVVVAIIAILVGLVAGISGYASRKAATADALSDLERIKNALEEYRLSYGSYLNTTITITGPAYINFTSTLSRIDPDLDFIDPWGRPYQYLSGGPYVYRLWSHGPTTNTTDDDADSAAGVY